MNQFQTIALVTMPNLIRVQKSKVYPLPLQFLSDGGITDVSCVKSPTSCLQLYGGVALTRLLASELLRYL